MGTLRNATLPPVFSKSGEEGSLQFALLRTGSRSRQQPSSLESVGGYPGDAGDARGVEFGTV
jgi:hypothetical protein